MKQISIFLQNENGSLAKVTEQLARQGIDMRAMCVADTQDYGILRMITDRHEDAEALLRREGYAFSVRQVTAVPLKDEAGALAKVARVCADHSIAVEYAYAFLSNQPGIACLILRTDDYERTARVLAEQGIPTADQEFFR